MDEDIEYVDDMTVTECPDCAGSGEVGEELACANPDAFYDDSGRHVIAVEDLEDETGPDTMGLQTYQSGGVVTRSLSAEEAAEMMESGRGVLAYDIRQNLDWPDDPIGVVVLGQDDGLAHRVSRALGGVDGPFTEQLAEQVNEFRREAGLEDYPPNCVVGKVWALVLPPLKVGYRGIEVMWLCKALGIPPSKTMSDGLMVNAIMEANPDEFDRHEDDSFLTDYEFDMVDWMAVL